MVAHLSVNERNKLSKLLALLGSDQPGERDGAALAAHRIVERSGLSWRQILSPPPIERKLPELGTWRATCARLQAHRHLLRAWERGFVDDLPTFRRLSVKQRYALGEIAKRVLRDGAP